MGQRYSQSLAHQNTEPSMFQDVPTDDISSSPRLPGKRLHQSDSISSETPVRSVRRRFNASTESSLLSVELSCSPVAESPASSSTGTSSTDSTTAASGSERSDAGDTTDATSLVSSDVEIEGEVVEELMEVEVIGRIRASSSSSSSSSSSTETVVADVDSTSSQGAEAAVTEDWIGEDGTECPPEQEGEETYGVDEDEEVDEGDEREEEEDEEDEEEDFDADAEEAEEGHAPELDRLFSRVAELRQRVLEIGGTELTPHLVRLRTLLEQVRVLHQGLDPEAIEANTLTMTLQSKPSPDDCSADAAQMQCMICLEEFDAGDHLRVLPCFHRYHCGCVDHWFSRSRQCPVCKHDVTSRIDSVRHDEDALDPELIETLERSAAETVVSLASASVFPSSYASAESERRQQIGALDGHLGSASDEASPLS